MWITLTSLTRKKPFITFNGMSNQHPQRWTRNTPQTFATLASIALVICVASCGRVAESYRVDSAFNRGPAGTPEDNFDALKPINLESFRFLEDEIQWERAGRPGQSALKQEAADAARASLRSARAAYSEVVAAAKTAGVSEAEAASASTTSLQQLADTVQKQSLVASTNDPYAPAYVRATSERTPELRNRLAAILIEHSDRIYAQHKARVQAHQDTANLLFDWTTLTTAGLAAVFTPAVTKTALATTAALSSGIQGSFNDRIFLKLLAPRILRETDLSRLVKNQEIESKRSLDTVQYTVDDMLRDVQDYHERGSFMHGVMLVATSSGISTFAGPASISSLDNDKLRARLVEVLSLGLGSSHKLSDDPAKAIVVEPTDRKGGSPITRLVITLKELESTTAARVAIADLGDRKSARAQDAKVASMLLANIFKDAGAITIKVQDKDGAEVASSN